MIRSKKNSIGQTAVVYLKACLQNKKVMGFCLAALALICTVALATYNATDSSWLYYNSQQQATKNFLGLFGAHISAGILWMFGMVSWLLLAVLWYIAYTLVRYERWWHTGEKFVALLLAPLAAAGLMSYYAVEKYACAQPGGLMGAMLKRSAVAVCDDIGAALFLHVFFIICVMLIAPSLALALVAYSWKGICFVTNREKFLAPVWRGFVYAAYWASRPFVAFAHFVRHVIIGSDAVLGPDQDIVTFEHIVVDNESLSADELWQTFLKTKSTADAQVHPAVQKDDAPQNLEAPVDVQPVKQVAPIVKKRTYLVPDLGLFTRSKRAVKDTQVMDALKVRAKTLEEKLERFGVVGSVVSIKPGPVVTLFEYQPHIDTKISKIIALEDDLAMALQALSIRIIAPIPGRSVVGFEVANAQRVDVLFNDSIHSPVYEKFSGSIPLVLGQDTVGNHVVIDLVKTPHLLVAGSTGSGKSVALNGMLVSMLCKMSPDDLKLILIDPKRLEFAPYQDIPHLLFPIVTDPRRAAPVLAWVVRQMEDRYTAMATCGARNAADYNVLMANEPEKKLPFIVVVIDELADLMMTAGREVEDLIARIAQMARAAGIHMIVATQRPSVDVITGLIKVNFPSRISFRVTSKIDSRTILDCSGADKLLGRGDMLYLDSGSTHIARLHGAYVSDREIAAVVKHVRGQRPVQYLDIQKELTRYDEQSTEESQDQLLHEVVAYVKSIDEVSISLLQRKFKIGYNRSARIVDALEAQGIIMPSDNGKTRKVIR